MGDANLLFLSSAGEHYLHSRNMLAMLNATKVMDNSGKEVSIFNAYTTIKETSEKGNSIGSVLVFKTGTKTEGGKPLFDAAMYEEAKRL